MPWLGNTTWRVCLTECQNKSVVDVGGFLKASLCPAPGQKCSRPSLGSDTSLAGVSPPEDASVVRNSGVHPPQLLFLH